MVDALAGDLDVSWFAAGHKHRLSFQCGRGDGFIELFLFSLDVLCYLKDFCWKLLRFVDHGKFAGSRRCPILPALDTLVVVVQVSKFQALLDRLHGEPMRVTKKTFLFTQVAGFAYAYEIMCGSGCL